MHCDGLGTVTIIKQVVVSKAFTRARACIKASGNPVPQQYFSSSPSTHTHSSIYISHRAYPRNKQGHPNHNFFPISTSSPTKMQFTTVITLFLATLATATPSPAPQPKELSPNVAVVLARELLEARNCPCFDKCSDGCTARGGCNTPGCNGGALLGW